MAKQWEGWGGGLPGNTEAPLPTHLQIYIYYIYIYMYGLASSIIKATQTRFTVYRQHFSYIPSGQAVIIHYSLVIFFIMSHAPQ